MAVSGWCMYLMAHDHQGKARGLMQALIGLGHEFVFGRPDVLLIDHDGPAYYRNIIEGVGAPAVLYPHGAGVCPAWDGVWEPHNSTKAMLTWGEGQADTLRAYGYPKPVHPVGWWLCERASFRAFEGELPKVLFGPIHPLNNGHLREEAKKRNARTYSRLLEMFNEGEIELTVRHVGPLGASGLFPAYGVHYRVADADPVSQIDTADLVVATGTMALLAMARGCPTVTFDQGMVYEDDGRQAEHWSEYIEEYPYSLDGLTEALARPATGYVARFIGGALDAARVTEVLEFACA